MREVVGSQVQGTEAERLKRFQNPPGMLWRRRHEQIDIARVTGAAMPRHRVSTDDEVLNALRVE